MKPITLKAGLLAAASFISIAPAYADSGFTGTVTLTSDYRFRGISQSDADAAIQGSVDYAHDSGFFAGVWASTIDFTRLAGDNDASVEIDLYVGYSRELFEKTNGTIKVVYYWYPDAIDNPGDPNYFEVIGGVTHEFGDVTVGGELAWTPDYYGETDDAVALTGSVSVPVLKEFAFFDDGLTASAHLGRQWYDSFSDYTFWDVGLSTSWGVFTIDARYVDTDINGCNDLCDAGVMLSLTANLPGE